MKLLQYLHIKPLIILTTNLQYRFIILARMPILIIIYLSENNICIT
jgi:hypothetical protein